MRDEDSDALWDPGLQHERTTLAWTRTALAFVVVSLLEARLAQSVGLLAVALALAGMVLAAGLVAQQASRHRRRHNLLKAGSPVSAPLAVLGATMLTVVLAAASIALLFI
jgi:uncharacterized membrane protein YidH (DUF202 family)